jgi:hypothetical protein
MTSLDDFMKNPPPNTGEINVSKAKAVAIQEVIEILAATDWWDAYCERGCKCDIDCGAITKILDLKEFYEGSA